MQSIIRETPDGASIRRARLAAGLSQEELAVRAGIGSATLARLEHNRTQAPNRSTLQVLAQALGVAPDALARRTGTAP